MGEAFANVKTTPEKNVLTDEQIRHLFNETPDLAHAVFFGDLSPVSSRAMLTFARAIESATASALRQTRGEPSVRYEPMTRGELREHKAVSGWRLFAGNAEVESQWWYEGVGGQAQLDGLATALLRHAGGGSGLGESEVRERERKAVYDALTDVANILSEHPGPSPSEAKFIVKHRDMFYGPASTSSGSTSSAPEELRCAFEQGALWKAGSEQGADLDALREALSRYPAPAPPAAPPSLDEQIVNFRRDPTWSKVADLFAALASRVRQEGR